MSNKAPIPDLEVFFEGSDIYPERIPVRFLADTLAGVHRLGTSASTFVESESVRIRLLDIQRGSAVFRCVADDAGSFIRKLRLKGRLLEHPEDCEDLADSLPAIKRLSEISTSLQCSIVVRNPSKHSDIIARIIPATYDQIHHNLMVSGEKSLTGCVQRVGGATETRCALRVAFQSRLLYCKVDNKRIARTIGTLLYQDVVVSGMAEWLKNSWRIVGFTILDVAKPRIGPLKDAIDAIREAGANRWDDVEDPAGYLDELSGIN